MPDTNHHGFILCSFGIPDKDLPRLPYGDLDVFYAETSSLKPFYQRLLSVISREEHEKAEKIISANVRDTYVISHATLRLIMAEYLNVDPSDICFTYNPNGKPSLIDNPVFFNLSHTSDAFAFGLSRDSYVGIDIEEVNQFVDYASISRSFFSTDEQTAIFNSDEDSRDLFYLLWTRKEAFIKSLGAGIAADLKKVEVSSARNYIDKTAFDEWIVENASKDHYIFSKKINKYYLSSSTPFLPLIHINDIKGEQLKF